MPPGIGKLQTLYRVSPSLSRVIGGKTAVTRQEALKDVWTYIKRENLQNPTNKREIIPVSHATFPIHRCLHFYRLITHEIIIFRTPN